MSEEEASAVAIVLRKLNHLTVRAGFISRGNLKEILLGCRELARGVGTSFVCLARVSRISRIPEWPPQDSNPSPRLKDDKVALLEIGRASCRERV